MRIYLGLRSWSGVLFIIVLIMGLSSILGFFRLQLAIEAILRNHYQSVLAGQRMVLALENQEQVVFLRLSDVEGAPGDGDLRQYLLEFGEALKEARLAAGNPGAEAALAEVKSNWDDYRKLLEVFAPGRNGMDWQWYRGNLLPQYWKLKERTRNFIYVNQAAIQGARDRARMTARYWSYWMAGMTLLGLLGSLLFNQQISGLVIQSVRQMTRFIDRVNLGETHLRVPVQKENYLDSLRISINRLIERFSLIREESRRLIKLEQQRSLALIEASAEPTVLTDHSGDVVMANEQARLLFTGEAGNEHLQEMKASLLAGRDRVELAGREFMIEVLGAGNGDVYGGGRVVKLSPAVKGYCR